MFKIRMRSMVVLLTIRTGAKAKLDNTFMFEGALVEKNGKVYITELVDLERRKVVIFPLV